ncbi:MAG: NifU N-terminal domain-containing protein [Actinomycetota bacterium]|nr:NifU N-terminal domain-containing protein [Actinomycetota bacterium]
MGQPIAVVQKPSSRPGVVRFEINRSLTGMGHERYRSPADATGDRPPDVLARRLFEHGGVDAVHVFSNVITVDLAEGGTGEGMRELIEELFLHYRDGVQPSIP